MHAYGTWNLQKLSSWKASSHSMIYRVMKSHTNECTVCSRPTLKIVKRFRKGSVYKAYKRSTIYTQTFWVNLSRIIPKELAINRGYGLFKLIKSILRSVIVFLDVIANQVGSQHKLITSEQQEQKDSRIYFCCLRMYLFEYNWVKRSEKLRNV